ncbi:DNA binding domain-containing protein, excisionase family [Pustulibacterium marinum]|uniref:DNA binding domain-containing protein, excisionase family n=1 Tax=Pustulibacterium marinum TaxID=1224947 RepID=A0A1I7H0S0_9FLAO|nr:helix-turn-helix domain-containing protein [Pustulibacterium marinum]SFU54308.1 DNA binding domain-containing protein, excisionase family [Pustulibacterium marinum]
MKKNKQELMSYLDPSLVVQVLEQTSYLLQLVEHLHLEGRFLSTKEVADRHHVCKRTVLRMVRRGHLVAVKQHNRFYYEVEATDRFFRNYWGLEVC